MRKYNGGQLEDYFYQPTGRDSAAYANRGSISLANLGGIDYARTYLPKE